MNCMECILVMAAHFKCNCVSFQNYLFHYNAKVKKYFNISAL